MTEHYTIDRVVNIIKNYHDIMKYVTEMLDDSYKSVGVAQYGIESVMPKGNGTGDQTQQQAFDNIRATKHVSKKVSDLKYINDRLSRITDERDAIIMYQLMSGKSQKEIADLLGCDKSAITYRIQKIAQQINGELLGYPQLV